MSYGIIYNQFFIRIQNTKLAAEVMQKVGGFTLSENDVFWMTMEPKFFWLMQSGDNNCYNHDGTRSRSWSIASMGRDVIKRALFMCMDIEAGMLRPGGRSSTPEAFLKSVRAKLKQAVPMEELKVQRIRWSLPRGLMEDVLEFGDDRERRIYQSAVQLRRHPYTQHLLDTGRLKLETDSFPYQNEKIVRFESAATNEETFLADYLWLSMLDTYYGEMAFRPEYGQSLDPTFAQWSMVAERFTQAA